MNRWLGLALATALLPSHARGAERDAPRLYRVILPVGDIERAASFYSELLNMEGERVSPGRYYFHTGHTILAIADPRADGDDWDARPNQDHVYLAVSDLRTLHDRATRLGGLSKERGEIEKRPWGEVSFYMEDPFGNPLCFVDETTLFTGHDPANQGDAMLGDSDFISFLSTAKPEEAKAFYVDVLGLTLAEDDPFALVLRGNGRLLRIQKVAKVPPAAGTALGWVVDNIEEKLEELTAKGVQFQRYDGLPQDERGIATFPNGDEVAWFLDPDGNVLSLSQLVAR